jgi:hypothetical protein
MYVMICKLGKRQEHIHVYYDYTKLNTKCIVSIFCCLGVTLSAIGNVLVL